MRSPFAMGMGGTIDVAAGLTTRAPVWMQKAGLEWFYRFLQEPKRMLKRYFIEDMFFFYLLRALLQKKDRHPTKIKKTPITQIRSKRNWVKFPREATP
jgi:N-acetylglucosaminyldiphosphoundecaprenol N-acetyl-beta-D-mannosaminyltransferase